MPRSKRWRNDVFSGGEILDTRTPLQRWLQRHPQPTQLRCVNGEGEARIVKIGVLRTKWRDAARVAEEFARVEALDDAGAMLRVFEDPELAGDDEAPPVPAELGTEDRRLVEFARLLNDVADKSAQRHADAYKMAFELIAELARGQMARAASYEQAWQKLVTMARRDAPDDGSQAVADGVIGQLLATVLAGQAQMKGDANGAG